MGLKKKMGHLVFCRILNKVKFRLEFVYLFQIISPLEFSLLEKMESRIPGIGFILSYAIIKGGITAKSHRNFLIYLPVETNFLMTPRIWLTWHTKNVRSDSYVFWLAESNGVTVGLRLVVMADNNIFYLIVSSETPLIP